jgi:regulator of sirC expression with transglutaminase-like and TPR domain
MTEAQIAYRNIYKAKQLIRAQTDFVTAADLLTSCVNFSPTWKSARKARAAVYKKLERVDLALEDLSMVNKNI